MLTDDKRAIEFNGYQCDIYNLRDGWIEEVKPREWYEVEFEGTGGEWLCNGIRYKSEQEARIATCRVIGNARFIKVREVLE